MELFAEACSDKAQDKGFKLKMDRFRFGIRLKFFTVRVLRHCNRLPRKVVDAQSLEVFKRQVGWGFEPPDRVKNVPAHPKRVGL